MLEHVWPLSVQQSCNKLHKICIRSFTTGFGKAPFEVQQLGQAIPSHFLSIVRVDRKASQKVFVLVPVWLMKSEHTDRQTDRHTHTHTRRSNQCNNSDLVFRAWADWGDAGQTCTCNVTAFQKTKHLKNKDGIASAGLQKSHMYIRRLQFQTADSSMPHKHHNGILQVAEVMSYSHHSFHNVRFTTLKIHLPLTSKSQSRCPSMPQCMPGQKFHWRHTGYLGPWDLTPRSGVMRKVCWMDIMGLVEGGREKAEGSECVCVAHASALIIWISIHKGSSAFSSACSQGHQPL